jgi:cytochrome c553
MFKGMILLMFLFMSGAAAAQSVTAAISYLSCAVCHGDGQGDDAIPSIRGRPHDVLVASLSGFAAEGGTATIMHRFITALTPSEIDDLARHISGLEGVAQ